MDYFLNIEIRPDPEFTAPLLMGVLCGKLHRALADMAISNLGVSFPEHASKPRSPGSVLRLHSNLATLEQLMSSCWLSGMGDHVLVDSPCPVPADVTYRVVRRVQGKTNVERLRRRHAKRHSVSLEEARRIIPDSAECKLKYPFVMLRSQSTAQQFPLFIEHLPEQSVPTEGSFNSYGLSKTATIPWF